jgi:hypothetical protein
MSSATNGKKTFPGVGRKRPQLNIPIELLELDPENPRLAKESQGSTQFDLLSRLYNEFDIEEVAFSMAENGYFDEEPVVVVPKKLPKGFHLVADIEQQQKDLQGLIEREEIKFVVVEGNRRVATAKLLNDPDSRKKLKIPADFPKPATKAIAEDLKVIPAIFYSNRKGISAYLGVRHIAGLLKWEVWAKTVYVASRIEEGIKAHKTIEQSIKEVQRQTADRSDVIKKQYLCYKVVITAKEDLNLDINEIKNRFSLVTVALNSPSIRDFVGVKSYKDVDFSKRIVPVKKLENLEKLLTWIYGNDGKQPILTDSRQITSRLSPVLADEDATDYLLKYENLEDAYERSGGEKRFLLRKINDATRNLRNALGVAYKYKTKDVIESVDECIKAADELSRMVTSDD